MPSVKDLAHCVLSRSPHKEPQRLLCILPTTPVIPSRKLWVKVEAAVVSI